MKKIDLCVGTDRERNIRVRLSLLFIDDASGSVMSDTYHSGTLHPGDNPQSLRDVWDAHLTNPDGGIPGAPWPKIPDAEWAEVEAIVSTLHTPERIAKRREIDRKNAEQFAAQNIAAQTRK